MNSEGSSSSTLCARDVVEVVREALAGFRVEGMGRREKVTALSAELRTVRERLERLQRRHPGVNGVALSDEVLLLLEDVRRERA